MINNSNQTLYNIDAELITSINLLNIANNIDSIEQINPGEISNVLYHLELNNSILDKQDLLLRLNISDNDMNFLESSIKLDVYGSNIIFDHIELIDNSILGPGLESEIKIYLKNIGSIDLNDIQLNLLHSGYSIDIIQSIVNYENLYAGQISEPSSINAIVLVCLLYTSDAADE